MARIVSFKVYLHEDGEPSRQEVRRFEVDADVVTNFEYFREKLQIIFRDLKGKRFTINWKDSDGDMITISSDEELVLALNETSAELIRKLYVKIQNDPQPNIEFCSSVPSTTLHVGVVCDGCNGLIRGFRFKCIQCSDFDLCSSCQSQGLHPEHCMLRLVNPLDAKAHFGRRFMRHMNKFAKKNSQSCHDDDDDDNDDETKVKDKSKGYKCGNKKWEKHNKPASNCPITSDLGSIIKTVTEYINEFAQIPTESSEQKTTKTENQTKQQTQNQNKNQTKEQSTSELKNNQENCSNSKENPKLEIPLFNQHTDLIKIVGQNLSYFLDPLGIDVNIQMKTSDHQEPTSSNSNVNSKAESPTPSTSKSNSGTTTPKIFNTKNDTDNENSISSSSEKKVSNEPATSKKNVEYVLEKDGHSDPEWTVIKEVTPETKEEPAKSSTPLYPQLPEENKIYHHNPKIQKAVELMIQMGFSNDNDQLTNLLVSKNGDIVSVIDILQQQQKF